MRREFPPATGAEVNELRKRASIDVKKLIARIDQLDHKNKELNDELKWAYKTLAKRDKLLTDFGIAIED